MIEPIDVDDDDGGGGDWWWWLRWSFRFDLKAEAKTQLDEGEKSANQRLAKSQQENSKLLESLEHHEMAEKLAKSDLCNLTAQLEKEKEKS